MRHMVASMLSSLMRVRGEAMSDSAMARHSPNTALTTMATTTALPAIVTEATHAVARRAQRAPIPPRIQDLFKR
jgi:hypothetical protein